MSKSMLLIVGIGAAAVVLGLIGIGVFWFLFMGQGDSSDPEAGVSKRQDDARRYARLLVSEIKINNEERVQAGRIHGDLYERLRTEIDQARQSFDERVQNWGIDRDYLHDEIVAVLCDGDATTLGASYPGPGEYGPADPSANRTPPN